MSFRIILFQSNHRNQLRKAYPNEAKHLSPLPEKKLFSSLTKEVVGEREKGIEEYMTTIVTKIPVVRLVDSKFFLLCFPFLMIAYIVLDAQIWIHE